MFEQVVFKNILKNTLRVARRYYGYNILVKNPKKAKITMFRGNYYLKRGIPWYML